MVYGCLWRFVYVIYLLFIVELVSKRDLLLPPKGSTAGQDRLLGCAQVDVPSEVYDFELCCHRALGMDERGVSLTRWKMKICFCGDLEHETKNIIS